MDIIIFLLSSGVFSIGLYNFVTSKNKQILCNALITLTTITVFINAADVFIVGNLTTWRQLAYLSQAVIFAGFSFRR